MLVFKLPKLTLYCQSLCFRCLHVANNLAVDVEGLGDGNHLIGGFFVSVDFQAVAHIEDFVHFMPVGARSGLNHAEERW